MPTDPESSRAFWGAASQIVPVLALALVLETRMLMTRWTRKKFEGRRRSRWAISIVYTLIFGTLPFVLLTSLLNTGATSTRTVDFVFVSSWVFICGMFVIYVPGTQLLAVSTSDMAQAAIDGLPWSAKKRTARAVRATSDQVDRQIRRERNERIDFLIRMADVYLELVPLEVSIDKQRSRLPRELQLRLEVIHEKLDESWAMNRAAKSAAVELNERKVNLERHLAEAVNNRPETMRDAMLDQAQAQLSGV